MAQLITLGTDSEIFARTKEGKAVSLCGLIGGTKDKPKGMEGLPVGFAVQEDNVSVEFNVPPAHNLYDWDAYIGAALSKVANMLDVMKLYFSENASISFDKDQLLHPNALIFGCEPDYNAWTKMENEKPRCNDPTLRTAGGHVHVGSRVNMIHGVEWMDLFLGVPSVILDDSPASVARRQMYGKAGAMRPKPYGFEYRVLSNFWIFGKTTRVWVYTNSKIAIDRADAKLSHKEGELIQQCINTGDKDLARELITKYDIPMPADLIPKEEPKKIILSPLTAAQIASASFLWPTNIVTHNTPLADFPIEEI